MHKLNKTIKFPISPLGFIPIFAPTNRDNNNHITIITNITTTANKIKSCNRAFVLNMLKVNDDSNDGNNNNNNNKQQQPPQQQQQQQQLQR